MKYILALLLVVLLAFGLLPFNTDELPSDEPITGLPWQIDILPNGDTQVFGITPGRTTFGEAMKHLDEDVDLAIIAAPHETGTLEAYFSHQSFGPITGKLFLVLDISPEALAPLRERAFQNHGTRKYHLHPDDLPVAYRAPVKVINYLPSFSLDEEIVHTRFGTPTEVTLVDARQKHYLYPGKGLDVILSTDEKSVLRYLSPDKFSTYRAQLQEQ